MTFGADGRHLVTLSISAERARLAQRATSEVRLTGYHKTRVLLWRHVDALSSSLSRTEEFSRDLDIRTSLCPTFCRSSGSGP